MAAAKNKPATPEVPAFTFGAPRPKATSIRTGASTFAESATTKAAKACVEQFRVFLGEYGDVETDTEFGPVERPADTTAAQFAAAINRVLESNGTPAGFYARTSNVDNDGNLAVETIKTKVDGKDKEREVAALVYLVIGNKTKVNRNRKNGSAEKAA